MRGVISRRSTGVIAALVFSLFLLPVIVIAGNLDSPATPASGSDMPTLQSIYNQLDTGATSMPAGAFQEPASGPTTGTGKSLSDIKTKLLLSDNTSGATANEVLSGKTFWGLRTDGTWGLKTGALSSMTDVSGDDGLLTFSIPDGYYSGKTATADDANLATENIKNGISIFGVTGSAIESTGNATGGDVLAGKTFSNADGAGISGSMPNNGAANFTPGAAAIPVPAGYYSGGQVNGDADLSSGNIRSGVTIFGVAGNTAVVNTTDATAGTSDMLSGKTAYINGSLVTGSASAGGNVSGASSSKTFTIPDGLYSGSKTATANDTNLVSGNIRAGVSIFGVAGNSNVVDTSSGDVQAYYIISGKKAWVDGQEITGTLNIRFVDNNNGTVTDVKTGLIWLKNAGCYSYMSWQAAINAAAGLASGQCGLTDGSTAGQWRLPRENNSALREWRDLLDATYSSPALQNAFGNGQWTNGNVFTNVVGLWYWSSTPIVETNLAYAGIMSNGGIGMYTRTSNIGVWPVRDRQ